MESAFHLNVYTPYLGFNILEFIRVQVFDTRVCVSMNDVGQFKKMVYGLCVYTNEKRYEAGARDDEGENGDKKVESSF